MTNSIKFLQFINNFDLTPIKNKTTVIVDSITQSNNQLLKISIQPINNLLGSPPGVSADMRDQLIKNHSGEYIFMDNKMTVLIEEQNPLDFNQCKLTIVSDLLENIPTIEFWLNNVTTIL